MNQSDRVKWVAIYTTHIPEEAHIISTKLDAAGITAIINGDTTRAFGFLVGRGAAIEVMVDIADAAAAEAVLADNDESFGDE